MANTNRLLDASGRTPEQAIANILSCTKKENAAKPVILADLRARYPHIRWDISDGGCDNSGAFIHAPTKVTLAPDWNLHSNDRIIPTEVLVHSEQYQTCSFKVVKLKYSVDQQSMTAVIRNNYWIAISHKGAKYLLDTYEEQSVQKINGGKPSIILAPEDLLQLGMIGVITKYQYTGAALDVMSQVRRELF